MELNKNKQLATFSMQTKSIYVISNFNALHVVVTPKGLNLVFRLLKAHTLVPAHPTSSH